MEVLLLIIPIGVFLSLLSFSLFELRAIKANKNTAIVSGNIPLYDLNEKFKHYETINNTALFTLSVFIFTFIIAVKFHDPAYGLAIALLYIFGTTFIGSIIIFLIKLKRTLLIKVFAAFLYGVAHIVGSTLAFLVSYLLYYQ